MFLNIKKTVQTNNGQHFPQILVFESKMRVTEEIM